MKVIVSGGSGFIGTRLVEELLTAGHSVRIFDKRPSARYPDLVTIGDVRDAEALGSATTGADAIFQLAAEHADDVTPRSLYYDVNVGGALNTVAAADANGIDKVVFTSSVAVYGLNRGTPDERCEPQPFNDYGMSKWKAECVFQEWHSASPARALTIVRPVVVFGEGNLGNVHNLITQVRNGRFVMVGSGRNRKSMAYVGNVAPFLVRTLDFGSGLRVLNYADNPDLSVDELMQFIRSELGFAPTSFRVPYALGIAAGAMLDVIAGLTGRKFSVSKVRIQKFCAETTVSAVRVQELGFRPPFTLEDGLRRMLGALDQGTPPTDARTRAA